MLSSPVVDKNTQDKSVPNGASGSGLFDFFGRLFVPDNVEDAWKENDDMIRKRAEIQSSSKDVQARITSSPAMLKSAENVREYVSAPFVPVLTAGEVGEIAVESTVNAPKVALDYTADNILAPATKAVNKGIMGLVPWPVWIILGLGVIVLAGVFGFVKAKG